MRVLVLGGTLFFGKRLVESLLDAGHEVTLVTRGQREDPFGDRVERRRADRSVEESLSAALNPSDHWDVVYDQIGYSPDDADLLTRLVAGRTRRLVFMSSGAVYTATDTALTESEFDPASYPMKLGARTEFDYGEGKRLAETVYVQRGEFEVVSARFPIVIGPDDYTRRLERLIERVRTGQPLDLLNEAGETPDPKVSLLTSADAARFLLWAGTAPSLNEPLNGQSGVIGFQELLVLIGQATKGEVKFQPRPEKGETGSFQIDRSSWLDRARALELGCPLESDLAASIRSLCEIR